MMVLILWSHLHRFIVVQVNQSAQQTWIRLFDRFVCIPNELGRFFLHFFVALKLIAWNPRLLLFVRVEVIRVPYALHLRNVRWFALSVLINSLPEFRPVYSCEKWMRFYLLYSVYSQPVFRISYELSKLRQVYLMRSAAWGDTFASLGMTKYFLQFWILCQVSLGSSDAKGGYPTSIS